MAEGQAALNPIQEIIGRQVRWARRNSIELEGHATARLEDNLFQPLHPETRSEFAKGAGDELGEGSSSAAMASLRSSAALAVNVFDAWRDVDLFPLALALGVDPGADRLSFERTFSTGLRGVPPHLDVTLDRGRGRPSAIECKFTEPYSRAHNDFRPSYFERHGIWDGLEATRALARQLANRRTTFEYLGAAQLIKHALGLTRAFGPKGFTLVYLWFEIPSEQSVDHKGEIRSFADMIEDEIEFRSLSYQELFSRLRQIPEPKPGYLEYLEDRYFQSG